MKQKLSKNGIVSIIKYDGENDTLVWKSRIRLLEPLSGLPLEIGACGEFNIRVSNARKLLLKVVGTSSGFGQNRLFGEDGEKGHFRSIVITQVKTNLAETIKKENMHIL